MKLRLAVFDDIEPILALLEQFHEENGIASLNLEKVADHVFNLIESSDLFLVEGDGIAGILGIVQGDLWYADSAILNDLFFYVAPEHRGGNVGKMLMSAASFEADRRGLPLFLSITNSTRTRKRGRVATLEGYTPTGAVLRLA